MKLFQKSKLPKKKNNMGTAWDRMHVEQQIKKQGGEASIYFLIHKFKIPMTTKVERGGGLRPTSGLTTFIAAAIGST